jgi:4'-phosphopantetheinyl transferase
MWRPGRLALPLPGECQLWWLSLADARPRLERLVGLLLPEERARIPALRQPEQFIASRSALQLTLAAHLGIRPGEVRIDRSCVRCKQQHGKPRLASQGRQPLEFSVAHSGEWLIMAVMTGIGIGVDIEQVTGAFPVMTLAPHVLTVEECAELAAEPPNQQAKSFFRYWTRKEAVVKATGRGLETPLRSFSVSGPRQPACLQFWATETSLDKRICLRDLDAGPGYAAALATIGACERITTHPTSLLLDLLDRDGPR